jgi:hypothetical protein
MWSTNHLKKIGHRGETKIYIPIEREKKEPMNIEAQRKAAMALPWVERGRGVYAIWGMRGYIYIYILY